jgi:hypothetical protein
LAILASIYREKAAHLRDWLTVVKPVGRYAQPKGLDAVDGCNDLFG